MATTFTERPLFDKRGLPKLTQRALVLVDADGTPLARRTFNPNSACSRILAAQRLEEDARRLDDEADELGNGVDDGVTIRFSDIRARYSRLAE
jgi:hypothetical protein